MPGASTIRSQWERSNGAGSAAGPEKPEPGTGAGGYGLVVGVGDVAAG